jgi:hypothetical protein
MAVLDVTLYTREPGDHDHDPRAHAMMCRLQIEQRLADREDNPALDAVHYARG